MNDNLKTNEFFLAIDKKPNKVGHLRTMNEQNEKSERAHRAISKNSPLSQYLLAAWGKVRTPQEGNNYQ